MRRYAFAGGTAVVTGAGSGIGEALSHGLADRGSHLVLVDQHADRLDRVAAAVRDRHPGLRVDVVVADLADHDATVALGTRLAAEHPETTLLVNNAGTTVGGELAELSLAEVDRVLEVDLRAVVSLTHGLLPVLLADPGAHVVVVSSIFGIFAAPGQVPYVTAKFGVRGFAEALRHELAGRVGVTVVHPGGIATRIAVDAPVATGADRAAFDVTRARVGRLLRITPADAAEAILRGVERRRGRVLIGWVTARFPDLLVRALPGAYGRVLGAFAGSPLDPRRP
ncbi:SDR family NAD(P)-dependent oxidoreductase [Microlunatus spumicola]|uniref:SDR family NAD(P)-dependent oxidoreductase n=1 Tax=Microlunatus spumicola TaxID=81499 RepID=A0ABP6XCL9_9ACTN